MNIQQIRNATLVVEYAGKKFLIDPMLAEKGAYPPFPNAPRQDQNNPLIELPTSVDNIIKDIDAVIVTHLHYDHWDETAKEVLPKNIKLFSQNEEDATEIRNSGFKNVEVLTKDTVFEGIQLIKTKGEHGRGEILKLAGLVCGVVFKHQSENTLYVAGDTVWYDAVQEEIDTHQPEIIVVNGGANQFYEGGSLIMGKEDIYETYKAAPNAKIIVSHMEAVNHWGLSKEELKSFINEKGITSDVLVPEDGESYSF
ncbi:MBL fold metallo-hydrolase [Bacillus mojavensis]|uniref:MBL fold metallo-hydrolase n=1 Tax=Bacillus mojavensis TaxID=72360 RepID=A0AAP3FVU5_BACMO|nr:MBL fold metallo-hydrolase [Bacillus mojavensis]MCY8105421.1 MBL fold metallo-hydrolase [Bacillus mojavensis]MCY8481834.1 MBL fold metallo-hydrolase [Bacillus mojavensis]MCY8508299.1 MBL fold metallo-hydrolase [Bacillus mojavensis]MEC1775991.1 MBL fold metallo-hydrolase [Bacillus mojavensis]MEC1801217.1 MBL fold metallo-hydrolase [Bacillus mojavensis]